MYNIHWKHYVFCLSLTPIHTCIHTVLSRCGCLCNEWFPKSFLGRSVQAYWPEKWLLQRKGSSRCYLSTYLSFTLYSEDLCTHHTMLDSPITDVDHKKGMRKTATDGVASLLNMFRPNSTVSSSSPSSSLSFSETDSFFFCAIVAAFTKL